MTCEWFIGLMSGTSLDGIDAALVEFGGSLAQLRHTCYLPYPAELRAALRQACHPGGGELDSLGVLDGQLADAYATAVQMLLAQADVLPSQVQAIGCHGQTVRHRPELPQPFSWQIGDPNRLAARTGIPVVADFRRRDMAVGGQGAPLAPAFHRAQFGMPRQTRVVLNLGGIANITVLPGDTAPVIGFDTGPANTLLDAWVERHLGQTYDPGGQWADGGISQAALLQACRQDPYFRLAPPKSTGREYFHLDWLKTRFPALPRLKPQDVQATLIDLTAHSVAEAILTYAPEVHTVFVCGGGAHNPPLLARIQTLLGSVKLSSTAELGIAPDWVEACTFAWLGRQHLHKLPGNLPSVTGASAPVILGGYYPA